MARFSDNPVKSPLTGSEDVPATDTSTGDDIVVTPDAITSYAQANMGLASGSSQGLVSGSNGDKLQALYTKAEIDALLAQAAQQPFYVFIGSPVDGSVEFVRNVLSNDVVLDFAWFALSSGSTNLTVTIDGTPVTGLDNLNITTASSGANATAANTLPAGSILGLTFTDSDSPQNLRLSIRGDMTYNP